MVRVIDGVDRLQGFMGLNDSMKLLLPTHGGLMKSNSYTISKVNFDKGRKMTIIRFQHSSKPSYKDYEIPFDKTEDTVKSWGFKPVVGDLVDAPVEIDMSGPPTYAINSVRKSDANGDYDGDLPLQPKLKSYDFLDKYFSKEKIPYGWTCPKCVNDKFSFMSCKDPDCINMSIDLYMPNLCPQRLISIPEVPEGYKHVMIFSGSLIDFKRYCKLTIACWCRSKAMFLRELKFFFMSDVVDLIKKRDDPMSTSDMARLYGMLMIHYDTLVEGHRQEDFLYQIILKWRENIVGETSKDPNRANIKPLLINIPGFPDALKMRSIQSLIDNKLITLI